MKNLKKKRRKVIARSSIERTYVYLIILGQRGEYACIITDCDIIALRYLTFDLSLSNILNLSDRNSPPLSNLKPRTDDPAAAKWEGRREDSAAAAAS